MELGESLQRAAEACPSLSGEGSGRDAGRRDGQSWELPPWRTSSEEGMQGVSEPMRLNHSDKEGVGRARRKRGTGFAAASRAPRSLLAECLRWPALAPFAHLRTGVGRPFLCACFTGRGGDLVRRAEGAPAIEAGGQAGSRRAKSKRVIAHS